MARRDWYCEDVLSGKLKVETIWENDDVLAFDHPRPVEPVHVVVIPKKHVSSINGPPSTGARPACVHGDCGSGICEAEGNRRPGVQSQNGRDSPGRDPSYALARPGTGNPSPRLGKPCPGNERTTGKSVERRATNDQEPASTTLGHGKPAHLGHESRRSERCKTCFRWREKSHW